MTTKKTTSVTLKNRDLLESQAAFAALDKCTFAPKILLNIARIGLTLKNATETVLQVRDKIAKEFFPDGKIDQEAKAFAAYRSKVEELLNESTTFKDLTFLSIDDLDLENNKLPVSVIMTLNWLIVD